MTQQSNKPNPSHIRECLLEVFTDAEIELNDLRGDGEHFALYIQSSAFNGKSRIEQHQMVFQALHNGLQDLFEETLSALAIQTADTEQ